MSSQREGELARAIIQALSARVGGFWCKIHGGPFQKAGLPDIVGCVDGKFFGIEVKMPGKEPTALQARVLEEITDSGGYATWVTRVGQAVSEVEAWLA